jgi:hypothetical protein
MSEVRLSLTLTHTHIHTHTHTHTQRVRERDRDVRQQPSLRGKEVLSDAFRKSLLTVGSSIWLRK